MKKFKYLFLISFLILSIYIFNIEKNIKVYDYVYYESYVYLDKIKEETKKKKAEKEKTKQVIKEEKSLDSFYGTVTAYSPYCEGCIGITASGYDVRNNVYYIDKEYGKIRVVAADPTYEFGTIIKLSSLDNYNNIIAIVLDRGSAIGNNRTSQIDLLFKTDEECYEFGRKYNAKIEILRYGY